MARRVLILGADGFIGRHIAFGFRAAGWQVLACARRTKALTAMGFDTLQTDLTDPRSHETEFWSPVINHADAVVNVAGLLTGSEAAFEAVHLTAPQALWQAAADKPKLLISAVGIDQADTPFARWRRVAEDPAKQHNVMILRPGLVLGDTSYGGSSMIRALAASPIPMALHSDQPDMNPIHAEDLSQAVIEMIKDPEPHQGKVQELGGVQTLSQAGIITAYRGWMGLPKRKLRVLPNWLASMSGRIGDVMRLGPISSTALAQLSTGVLADDAPLRKQLSHKPRGFTEFLSARPAGTQDLWQARLYLLRPILRIVLVLLWLVSGLIGLFLPAEAFLPYLQRAPLSDVTLIWLARLGGAGDLALAALLFRGWRLRLLGWLQIGMVGAYTLGLTLLAPMLWLLPIGGLLKNLPILVLLLIFLVLEDER